VSDSFYCERVEGESLNIERTVKIHSEKPIYENLEVYGEMPLPPYIKRDATEEDASTYQTVFAEEEGAVAAPTAGLHFTDELLIRLQAKGVEVVYLTLHVGYGTFRSIETENIEDHALHEERFTISSESAGVINCAKQEGRRVIACGTTVVRTLESSVDEQGQVCARSGRTQIYIYPPYQFKVIDGLITNFHLPKSSLFLLVSAFAGCESTLKAYQSAIQEQYRFYSYGDAMFVS